MNKKIIMKKKLKKININKRIIKFNKKLKNFVALHKAAI